MTNRMHSNQNDLERAFLAFNQHSLQLETAYRALQIRVSQLGSELAAARSDRKREQAEKERIAARMAHLLDALPGGVLVLDADGTVAETNPAARQLLGEPGSTSLSAPASPNLKPMANWCCAMAGALVCRVEILPMSAASYCCWRT